MDTFSLVILVAIPNSRYNSQVRVYSVDCHDKLCSLFCPQMIDTVNYLGSNNVKVLKKGQTVEAARNGTNVGATVGMLWLDVEGTDVKSQNYHLSLHRHSIIDFFSCFTCIHE